MMKRKLTKYIMLHKQNGKPLFKVRKDLHEKFIKAMREKKDADMVTSILFKMIATSPDGIEKFTKGLARNINLYKNRIMTQLTTKMAEMWKAGKWKFSYTNFNCDEKTKGFLAVSGRYFYLINFIGLPQIVSFKEVPKTYQKYVNPNKIIYKIPSKLIKVEKREGMR